MMFYLAPTSTPPLDPSERLRKMLEREGEKIYQRKEEWNRFLVGEEKLIIAARRNWRMSKGNTNDQKKFEKAKKQWRKSLQIYNQRFKELNERQLGLAFKTQKYFPNFEIKLLDVPHGVEANAWTRVPSRRGAKNVRASRSYIGVDSFFGVREDPVLYKKWKKAGFHSVEDAMTRKMTMSAYLEMARSVLPRAKYRRLHDQLLKSHSSLPPRRRPPRGRLS